MAIQKGRSGSQKDTSGAPTGQESVDISMWTVHGMPGEAGARE